MRGELFHTVAANHFSTRLRHADARAACVRRAVPRPRGVNDEGNPHDIEKIDATAASAQRRRRGDFLECRLAEITASTWRALLDALQAVADGDFSVRLPGDWTGVEGKIADCFNDIVAANQKMAKELARVGQAVGREGKTRQRMRFDRSDGALGRNADVVQHADRRSRAADH